MKKLQILFLSLLILTISACKTCPKTETKITLPPKPERSEIKKPETLKDYAMIIVYYEYLVQDWELWGKTVEELIDGTTEHSD